MSISPLSTEILIQKSKQSLYSLYTKPQLSCLDQFKEHVERNYGSNPIFDDWFLIRFCKRRSWKIKEIISLWSEYHEWRTSKDMFNILTKDLTNIENFCLSNYHHWYPGIDNLGRPISIESWANMDLGAIASSVTIDEWVSYFSRDAEFLIHVVFPYCSKLAGRRIDRSFVVFDIEGLNITKIIFDTKLMAFAKAFVKVVQEFYPALLDQLFIINAPVMFTALWSIIKIWLSEKTRKKIKIFRGGYHSELYQICDPDQLPKCLGGDQEDFPNNPQVISPNNI